MTFCVQTKKDWMMPALVNGSLILHELNRAVVSEKGVGLNCHFGFASRSRTRHLPRSFFIEGSTCFNICCTTADVDLAQHPSYRRLAVRHDFRLVSVNVKRSGDSIML